jgi:Na+/alanine symporter
MKIVLDILYRIIAVFIATALATIGTGSIVGVSIAQSALMAGAGAVAAVVERLARAFIDDGKLTEDEINAAFNIKDPKGTADGLGETVPEEEKYQ